MKKKKNYDVNVSLILQDMLAVLIIIISLGIMIVVGKNKEKWVLDGNKVSKGKNVYEIGDYYEYDESKEGIFANLKDVKWKILGVSDTGHLLIVSTSNVEELTLGSIKDIEKTKNDYIEGNKKLDEIASKYAHGKNAIYGRSINIDDINKITKVSKDSLIEQNTNISYYWSKENEPISSNEKDNNKTIFKIEHNNEFLWFDTAKIEWNISKKTDNENIDYISKIVTLNNSLITYNYEVYDKESGKYIPFMSKDTKEYNMLFKDEEGKKALYWTSTKYINATEKYVAFGYNVVKNSDLNYNHIIYSSQNFGENTFGVRAVIEIK